MGLAVLCSRLLSDPAPFRFKPSDFAKAEDKCHCSLRFGGIAEGGENVRDPDLDWLRSFGG